jgi:hypothetical protein
MKLNTHSAAIIFILLTTSTAISIQIQTKILASITVNLYDGESNNLVPKIVAVHEGDSMELASNAFCESVGALNTMQMPCKERILTALRAKFQQRLQNDLIFDLTITNEFGVAKSFFYFKNDNVNDAVLSFFYANPEFSNDSTSIATLHSAIVARLTTISQQTEEQQQAQKDTEIEDIKDEDTQTLLIITDHCKSFKDVQACRMELMYGPYQVAVANDVDAFANSMKALQEEEQTETNISSTKDDGEFGSYMVYGMFIIAFVMKFMNKQKHAAAKKANIEVDDIVANKAEINVVNTVVPTKLNVLSEISNNKSFTTLVPSGAKKPNHNNNKFNIHQDQENINNSTNSMTRQQKHKRKSLKKILKSPLRFKKQGKAFARSPMPRI